MKQLTEQLFVAGQIGSGDMETLVKAGVKTIINNRPDHEEMAQPLSAELAALAEDNGIDFHDIPVAGGQVARHQIETFGELMETADKPILAFCRSGTRSTMLWALSQAGDSNVDEIIQTAASAGYDFRGYRPMLLSIKSS